METLRVSSKSRPNSVAGAIAALLRTKGEVEVQAIGPQAVNQAVKAIAIARGYIAPDNLDLVVKPAFVKLELENEERTALKFSIKAHPWKLEGRDASGPGGGRPPRGGSGRAGPASPGPRPEAVPLARAGPGLRHLPGLRGPPPPPPSGPPPRPLLPRPEGLPPEVRWILRLGALEWLEGKPDHARVSPWVEEAKRRYPGLAGLVNAVLRRLAPREAPECVRLSLPDWLCEAWRGFFGDVAFAEGFNEPAPSSSPPTGRWT